MKIGEVVDINAIVKSNGIDLDEAVASFSVSDKDISGGRKIINAKSNQLFTGRFEKQDVLEFKDVWLQYKRNNNNIEGLRNQLTRLCNTIIKNYRGEVSPIEVMLYTSNVIASSFSNNKLSDEIANVVYFVCRENTSFLSSLEHIVKVWEWEHIINICAIATGKICADSSDNVFSKDLLQYIFDRFAFDDQTKLGCFMGLLESKNEEFIPDILNVVHNLKGNDLDKIIGNAFKKYFYRNFPGYYGQLNQEVFSDSSKYTQELVRRMLQDNSDDSSLVGQYKKASTSKERNELVDLGITKLKKGGEGVYDAVNLLKTVGSNDISKRVYSLLKFDSRKEYDLRPVISYFSTIDYRPANEDMKQVKERNDYYAACRVALFKQGVISSDEFVSKYLSETRPSFIKEYLKGFYGINDRISDVRNSAFSYFSNDLSEEKKKRALSNYERLIRQYKHLYNPQIGELIKTYFGFGTEDGNVRIRMEDQNTCLNIIEMIIVSSNYKTYEDFLYYVAEQGMDFSSTISNHARQILRNINSDRIKL